MWMLSGNSFGRFAVLGVNVMFTEVEFIMGSNCYISSHNLEC